MKKVYLQDTTAPYQYNVRDYKTDKLLGYTDSTDGFIEADTNNKWLKPPIKVIVMRIDRDD